MSLEQELEQLKAEYFDLQVRHEKLRTILSHVFPEKTGSYFISGQSGMVDSTGLPDVIYVCPTYGVDWVTTYERKETKGNIVEDAPITADY
jgi:hypothetical protein